MWAQLLQDGVVEWWKVSQTTMTLIGPRSLAGAEQMLILVHSPDPHPSPGPLQGGSFSSLTSQLRGLLLQAAPLHPDCPHVLHSLHCAPFFSPMPGAILPYLVIGLLPCVLFPRDDRAGTESIWALLCPGGQKGCSRPVGVCWEDEGGPVCIKAGRWAHEGHM